MSGSPKWIEENMFRGKYGMRETIGSIINPNSQKEWSKLINHKEVINAQMNQTMKNMKKGGNPIIYYRK